MRHGGSPRSGRTLAVLCVIQLLSWGVLFYSLPVALTRVSGATGWSTLFILAVYTTSQLCAALAGPRVGQLTDALGPRRVMASGSALGAVAMLLSAVGPSPGVFAGAWAVVGLAQSMTLYPVAFAAASQWCGARRGWPLTVLTLAGGVSSTAFAPLTAAIVDDLGWRAAFAALAVGYGVISTTMAAALLTQPWRRPSRVGREHRAFVDAIAGTRAFRDLRVAFALAAAGLYAVTLNLIPLLEEIGYGYRRAAVIFGLVGAGQIVGRGLFLPLSSRGGARTRAVAQVGLTALALCAVASMTAPAAVVVAGAAFAGAVRGAHTLVVATTVSDRWGVESYASVFGRFHLPIAVAMALGPFAGGALATATGSYRASAFAFAALATVALLPASRS